MDKLASGIKVFRDPSPISGMKSIFHLGDNNQNKNRGEEKQNKKTREKIRDGEMVDLERTSDRERPYREGEREWRDGEGRQACNRGKHGRPPSSIERSQTERDERKGKKKHDTYPRERKGEIRERQTDQPQKDGMNNREIESRAIEEERRLPEDIGAQKRERYKVSGVEFQERSVKVDDSWDRRHRDVVRKREKPRAVMESERESERYSPRRTPETEEYAERRERTPRRDTRSVGDVEERELNKKGRMRGREREEIHFSRVDESCQSRIPQDRDPDGNQGRYRGEGYKRREHEDWEGHRDGRMEVRSGDRARETWREVRSDGRRDDGRYRYEGGERERKKRQKDQKAGISNRSLSESSQVSPQGQSTAERGREKRDKRDLEIEQRRGSSVANDYEIDPGKVGEKDPRQLARKAKSYRDETTYCGSDQTRMLLEPQRGMTQPRQKEKRVDKRDIKSLAERERDARGLQGDPDVRNMTSSGEGERRKYSEDTESVCVEGNEAGEMWKETSSEGKKPQSDSGGRTERSHKSNVQGENVLIYSCESGSDEKVWSDSEGRGRSDGSWDLDGDTLPSSEESVLILSSGEDWDDFSKPGISSRIEEELTDRKEEVIHAEDKKGGKKLCGVGKTSSQSESSEVSVSQDEEKHGVVTDDPSIENHYKSKKEDFREPQHERPLTPSKWDEQPLIHSQGTGNGYSTPRNERPTSGSQSMGDFSYKEPEDLHDKNVKDTLTKELPPNDKRAKKRDSKTEKLLKEWREKNNRKGDQTFHIPDNSCVDIPLAGNSEQIQPFQEMSPEEVEAIRIRMSGTWCDTEETKRRSQPPHLKWAKTVVREILGTSGEKTEDEPNSEVEENQSVKQAEHNKAQEEADHKGVNLPILMVTTDSQQSETEQEEDDNDDDLDYPDDDLRSKSLGEMDLRKTLNSIGRLSRRSSFYNRPQLYQVYNEEKLNIEILRQSRSDAISLGDVNSRSPLPSPQPARRPLPPLPSNSQPLYHMGSLSCPQTLNLLDCPRPERRASSPTLSRSLTHSSSLWRDLPEVQANSQLEKLTEAQRRLQEVRFEVVTSEASYCRSLDIVVEHFVKCKELEKLLSSQDRNWLFSGLTEVRVISHRFLSKLEERMESNIMHFTVCDIIAQHCPRFKKVYVPYLTNQSYQDATYQRLMNDNPSFKRVVENLEMSAVCQRLPLRSFLVLPFQRITRIKLLVQNILKKTTPGTKEADETVKALRRLEKIIKESNDSIARMKTIESLVSLSGKVEFVDCKTLPLISEKRRLVREGSITELMEFSLKQTERTLYLHLFNDYLLVSIQKEGGRFTVIDHSPVEELRTEDFRVKIFTLQKNSFRLHMSHRSLLLRTETQSDKLRWISALSRAHPSVDFSAAENSEQMQCIRAYVAQQPDELSVEKADVIVVHQESSDHWVEGIRLPDLQCGWVPKSYLKVISNDDVKKRNLSDALTLTKATAAV